jgi:hypothetical protein
LITDRERNVRFYRRLGFDVGIQGSEVDPIALWSMTRQPARN